jgi:DNA-binding IclR family transcriptional regulator
MDARREEGKRYRMRVLAYLREHPGPNSAPEISRGLGLSYNTVRQCIDALSFREKIAEDDGGKFMLIEDGENYVE